MRKAPLPENLSLAGPLRWTLSTSGLIQVANVLTGILLARELGPYLRGELAAVILWPTALTVVGSLGISEAATHYAAWRAIPLGTLLGTTTSLIIALSAVLVAAGLPVMRVALSSYDQDAIRTATLFLVFIPLSNLASALIWILNGIHSFAWFQVLRLMVHVFPAIAFLLLIPTNELDVRSAALSYLLANALVLVTASFILLRLNDSDITFSWDLARKLLSFGIRGHPSTVFGMLNERLDQLFISILLTPEKLGVYVVAVTVTSLTTLIGSSIGMVVLPALSRLRHRAEGADAIRRLIKITATVSLLVTLPILVGTPTIIRIFFGESFIQATDPARVLLMAAISLSIGRMLAMALKGMNRPLSASSADAIGFALTAALLPFLLPSVGLMGAAIASLVAYTASTGWMIRQTARVVDSSVPKLIGMWPVRVARRRSADYHRRSSIDFLQSMADDSDELNGS